MTIVVRVSPSCVNIAARGDNSLQEYFSASMFASALTAMVSSHESIKNISLIFIILINGEFCHIFEHLSVKILYFRNKAVK